MRSEGAQGPLPPVPMGHTAWSDATATAIAVELAPSRSDAPRTDLELAMRIAPLLPSPTALANGTFVFVLGEASSSGGFVMRLLKRDREQVSRAARATALLARGFSDIGAAQDDISGHDLVWGIARS